MLALLFAKSHMSLGVFAHETMCSPVDTRKVAVLALHNAFSTSNYYMAVLTTALFALNRHSLILIPTTEHSSCENHQTRHGIAVSWNLIFMVQNESVKTEKRLALYGIII